MGRVVIHCKPLSRLYSGRYSIRIISDQHRQICVSWFMGEILHEMDHRKARD